MSTHWERQGRNDKAIEQLQLANAFTWLAPHADELKKSITRRRKALKVSEELGTPSEDALRAVGLLPIAEVGTNLTRQAKIGRPVGFYNLTRNEATGAQELETLVYTLIYENAELPVLKLQQLHKQASTASWSTIGSEGGKFNRHGAHFSGAPNRCPAVSVAPLDDGRYEFTFSTH